MQTFSLKQGMYIIRQEYGEIIHPHQITWFKPTNIEYFNLLYKKSIIIANIFSLKMTE